MKIKESDNLIILAVVITASAIFYNMMLAPQINGLKAVRTQYVSQKELVKVRYTKKSELDKLRKNTLKWKEKADDAEGRFLKKEDLTEFFKNLDQVGRDTGVKVNSIDPLENRVKEKDGIVDEMQVLVEITGRYTAIKDFVKTLFNGKKLLTVRTMEISSVDQADGNILESSIVLTLFLSRS
ncbi:MAG: type 4a pilus biogenesis protein PilO [Candidatus Omnitrophota bacterium]|nr:type 4a pilus biogenesis protein PilO [Candidatus Omnitrophota bacterium]